MTQKPTLTTSSGAPVADNQNSITAGPRGPLLMQDFYLLEKLAHQNRERIPERTVHAKGSAAYGTLTVTNDISKYTGVAALSKVGKKTEAFLRFSVVAGERGAADAERDVRGFALRFYTEGGNWDIVGNNTPVFFVRDPLKFPDFIHTQKRHPKTNMRSPTAMWDFWSLSPESLHQVTILMSDRGLPQSYRNLDGFGSHTYSFINAENERHWVRFHFKTMQGIKNWTNAEAAQKIAYDRETHQRDLFEAIERGDFPKWKFSVQIMPESDVGKHWYNPFDLTKVWPHADYPLIEVGVQSAFGQQAALPGAHLPYRRHHAARRQSQPGRLLRAQLDGRSGAGHQRQGAAVADLRQCRPLQSPRRQRRLPPGRRPVPADERRSEGTVVQQHQGCNGRRADGDRQASGHALLSRRSGLRHRRRHAHGPFRQRSADRTGGRVSSIATTTSI